MSSDIGENSLLLRNEVEVEAISKPQKTVEDLINDFGLGKFQVKMFFLCGLCWTADAMEIMMLEFLFREIKIQFDVGAGMDGIMSGIVFLGMFCGAFFWGTMSDRYGRKVCYFYSSLFVGIFGMLTATSHAVWIFMVYRFLVGFGFGGSHCAFTLWQEFTPENHRGNLLLLNQIFWTIGALTEALLAWAILPSYGWRMLVVCSSILPFITCTFYWFLPESPRYLMVHNREDEASQVLRDVARANGHEYPEHSVLVLPESQHDASDKTKFFLLFDPVLLTTTLGLFLIWAADTFTYYGGAFITPKFFEDSSLYTAAIITTLSEIPGIFLPMLTMDSLGRKATLGILMGIASVFFLLIAFIPDKTVILVCLCVARMCTSSAFTVTFIYTSEVFPTMIRSTGLGSASAISRLAGFVTSFVATSFTKTAAGLTYSGFAILAAVMCFLLPYETSKRPMFDTIVQMADFEKGQTGDYKKNDGANDEESVHNLHEPSASSSNPPTASTPHKRGEHQPLMDQHEDDSE